MGMGGWQGMVPGYQPMMPPMGGAGGMLQGFQNQMTNPQMGMFGGYPQMLGQQGFAGGRNPQFQIPGVGFMGGEGPNNQGVPQYYPTPGQRPINQNSMESPFSYGGYDKFGFPYAHPGVPSSTPAPPNGGEGAKPAFF